jgi:hypothetical protein
VHARVGLRYGQGHRGGMARRLWHATAAIGRDPYAPCRSADQAAAVLEKVKRSLSGMITESWSSLARRPALLHDARRQSMHRFKFSGVPKSPRSRLARLVGILTNRRHRGSVRGQRLRIVRQSEFIGPSDRAGWSRTGRATSSGRGRRR